MQTTKLTNILLSNASHEGRDMISSQFRQFFIILSSENTPESHNQVRDTSRPPMLY